MARWIIFILILWLLPFSGSNYRQDCRNIWLSFIANIIGTGWELKILTLLVIGCLLEDWRVLRRGTDCDMKRINRLYGFDVNNSFYSAFIALRPSVLTRR